MSRVIFRFRRFAEREHTPKSSHNLRTYTEISEFECDDGGGGAGRPFSRSDERNTLCFSSFDSISKYLYSIDFD